MKTPTKMPPLSAALFVLPLAAALTLFPFVSSGLALVLGAAAALTLGNPYLHRTRHLAHRLLAWSVVGLGAGMNLGVVTRVGLQGISTTAVAITATLLLGALLGRAYKTRAGATLLITVGTAICGGSAIAALSPVARSRPEDISVAMGTVFLLNAVALFLFPWVGHALGMSQAQFGLWSALAIHDTSSVVGATLSYGTLAFQIGTTVKLARALWIVPLTLAAGWYFADRGTESTDTVKRPWFIVGFLGVAALVTWIPGLRAPGHWVSLAAQKTFGVTLFLIGTNLTRTTLKDVGFRPLALGLTLWAIVATTALKAVLAGWIHVSL